MRNTVISLPRSKSLCLSTVSLNLPSHLKTITIFHPQTCKARIKCSRVMKRTRPHRYQSRDSHPGVLARKAHTVQHDHNKQRQRDGRQDPSARGVVIPRPKQHVRKKNSTESVKELSHETQSRRLSPPGFHHEKDTGGSGKSAQGKRRLTGSLNSTRMSRQ